jgi:hypothetical protein
MRRPSSRTTAKLRVSAAPITGTLFRQAARFEVWLRQFDPLQIFAATVLIGLAAYVMWQNWQSSRPQQNPVIIVVATTQPGDLDLVGKVVAPLAGGAAPRPSSTPQPAPIEQPAMVVVQPVSIVQSEHQDAPTATLTEQPTALPAVTSTPTMIVPRPPLRPKPLQPPVMPDQPIVGPLDQPTQPPEPMGTY